MSSQTFQLVNSTNIALALNSDSFTFIGPGAQYYSMTTSIPPEGILVNIDSTFDFDVEYNPTASGVHDAVLQIRSNYSELLAVSLTGRGLSIQQIETFTYEDTVYDYQIEEQGNTERYVPITVRNNGEVDLTVSDIVYQGVTGINSYISTIKTTPATISPGQTVKIADVAFDISAAGTTTATLNILHNSPIDSGVTPIQAVSNILETDSSVEFNVSSVNLGNVNPNTLVTYGGTLRIQAPLGNHLNVVVTGVSSSNADFSVNNSIFPVTLTPGEFIDITLQYQSQPLTIGAVSTSLTISTTNPFVSRQPCSVSANVITVKNLTYSLLNTTTFPNRLAVGQKHPLNRIVRFTAAANNNAPVAITPQNLIENFYHHSTTPVSLTPGQHVDLELCFRPVDFVNGTRNGLVRYVTDSNLGTLNLTCYGVANVIKVDPYADLLLSQIHDLSSNRNPFGTDVRLKNGAVWIDNRDTDYPVTITGFQLGNTCYTDSRALTDDEKSVFGTSNSFPLVVPANSSRIYQYDKVPFGEDFAIIVLDYSLVGVDSKISLPIRARYMPSNNAVADYSLTYNQIENLPVEYQTVNYKVNNHVVYAGDATFNIAGNPATQPHGVCANGRLELPSFMHEYNDEWYDIKIRNDGSVDLEFVSQLSSMYHLTPEINHSDEPNIWVVNDVNIFFGGFLMYWSGRVLADVRSNGGRHPNNTYWMIDQTQQHVSGTTYVNHVIAPGQTKVIARVRKIRANAPPMLLTLQFNSDKCWFMQMLVCEKDYSW
jgi:hypothetical protein